MRIKDFFEKHSKVAVAVSGGVDSAVLLHFAVNYASEVYPCFVNNGFQPRFALTDAENICVKYNLSLKVIDVSALKDSRITANDNDRCYYCKKQMFIAIKKFADNFNADVVDGTNADDNIDDRPGFRALAELGIFSPLKMSGMSKAQIRSIAEENNIYLHNKPSYSCLATRVRVGNEITNKILETTEMAENELIKLGYSNFRIRYKGGRGELELTEKDVSKYMLNKSKVDSLLSSYYDDISLSERVREYE